MRAWWEPIAAESQAAIRASEELKNEQYTEGQAHRAAVYSREDLILAVSHLSAVNVHLAILCRLVGALVVIAGVALIRSFL